MKISIIVAMDRNRLIGRDGGLPWKLPADLAHFKKTTMGKPILMGRATWESIGRPLPGRTNIVMTRNADFTADGVVVVHDVDQAMTAAGDAEELMVIGGAAIYELFLSRADCFVITEVAGAFEGDTWFPAVDVSKWQEVESVDRPADDRNAHACRFVTYLRR